MSLRLEQTASERQALRRPQSGGERLGKNGEALLVGNLVGAQRPRGALGLSDHEGPRGRYVTMKRAGLFG
jgi:hypothetical protein